MATDTAEKEKAEAADAESSEALSDSSPASGGGFMKKIIIVGVLLMMVMGMQFGILMYFFSGTSNAEPADVDGALPEQPAIGDPSNPGLGNTTEVEVGDFVCTNAVAAQGHSVHITFRLVAIVPSSMSDQFGTVAKKENKFRVREVVDHIIRSSERPDLNDPSLDMIKRRIKEDINKILGKSYINKVIIADFKLMEQ